MDYHGGRLAGHIDCRHYLHSHHRLLAMASKKRYITMTLNEVKKGQRFIIKYIPAGDIHAQAIRFGISEGSEVECAEHIPSGPIIISRGHQEIAIGHRLACTIIVE